MSLGFVACLLCLLLLVAGGVCFAWLKREIESAAKPRGPDTEIQSALTELALQIGQMRVRLEEVEARKAPLSDWVTAEPSSLNLNRRGQVLRLYRRGDSVAHIASTLGLSTGEVALIVKVQEMAPPGRGPENPASEL